MTPQQMRAALTLALADWNAAIQRRAAAENDPELQAAHDGQLSSVYNQLVNVFQELSAGANQVGEWSNLPRTLTPQQSSVLLTTAINACDAWRQVPAGDDTADVEQSYRNVVKSSLIPFVGCCAGRAFVKLRLRPEPVVSPE